MSAPKTSKALPPILLIEDEPSVSAFVRAALERRGYKVVQAKTGADGIRELSAGDYVGVISDIRMPGELNGADVHHWIQHNRPELCRRTSTSAQSISQLRWVGISPTRMWRYLLRRRGWSPLRMSSHFCTCLR